ncbi:hypothetical protein CBF30_03075 [Vagococcus entomophilus]|uniref:Solute-binding protein family 5 domain-containing protein n=2 Tax=Vagococcus entomophilus TaxID=1160095 RepID=A0A430AJK2_9ENTE|nr:hypothetical protein CBF30_03075 [Vagococcus entomophilus]
MTKALFYVIFYYIEKGLENMKRKDVWLMGVLLVGILFIGGCSTTTKKNDSSTSKTTKTQLVVTTGSEISSMDTSGTTDLVSYTAMNNVFEGLFTLDKNGKTALGVAASQPKVSSDGKIYTFKLNTRAKWSNGTPVTAQDFVFAWQKLINPSTASSASYMFTMFKNAEQIINGKLPVEELGVVAVDDHTLKVELETPTPYLVNLLTLPCFAPQNKAYVTSQKDQYGNDQSHLIYNGPFVLSNWKQGDTTWTYKKNPAYWDKKNVKLSSVKVNVLKDSSTEMNLYESEQIDYASLSGDFISQYQSDKNYHSVNEAASIYIPINQTVKGLDNVHIRKAMSYIINKEAYVKNVMKNSAKALTGYVPANMAANPKTGEDFRKESGKLSYYDKKQALSEWKQGLKEAGLTSLELNLSVKDSEETKKLAEFLQSELQNLPGMKVTISTLPLKSLLESISSKNYQIAVSSWYADFTDPINFLERLDGKFTYQNETVNQLLTASKTTDVLDKDKRWQDLIKAEQIAIGQDMALIPLYQPARTYLLRPYVKDLVIPVFGPDSYKYVSLN